MDSMLAGSPEATRLESLYRYGMLEKPSDAIFDCIATTASSICETPIALVCLIESNRQWFGSNVGKFCLHAISVPDELTEVFDATEDTRFKDSPAVTGAPKIRFYAGKPLRTPEGCPLGTLCVMGQKPQRLTKLQKRSLASLAELTMQLINDRADSPVSVIGQAIESQIPSGVVLTDAGESGYCVTYSNRGFETMTGYTPAEVCGRNLRFLQVKNTCKNSISLLKSALAEEKPVTVVLRNARKDGTEFWNQLSLSPVRSAAGKVVRYLGIQADVTERIEMEAALKLSNERLQEESITRKKSQSQTTKLQAELAHLGRVSTMGEMATGLAHEINQPLTALSHSTFTASTLLQRADGVDPIVLECLEDIQHETQRAGDIIRTLRKFIRRGESKKAMVDIIDLAKQAIHLVKSDTRTNKIQFDLQSGNIPLLFADRVQIAQVFVNLMRNSIDAVCENKRSDRCDGKIQICINRLEQTVEVAITDNGPGVSADVSLFMVFETSKSDGLGIGLSISQSIIESHGGEIWHDQTVQTGCRIVFALPLGDTEQC